MSIYNNLARWTLPTTDAEKAAYAKHAPTIARYGFSLKAIQTVWLCFSVNAATKLLADNLTRLPILQPFAPLIAVLVLLFMHYILYHEVIETISNLKDKDEKTVNGFMNWIIPIVLIIGLGAIDVKSVTSTLRTDGFEDKKAANSTEAKAMLADARRDYESTLSNIATNRYQDSTNALAPFQKDMQKAESIKTYDAADIRAKNAKIAAINANWRIELGEVRKKAADDTRTAEANYTAEKNRINGKSDSTHTSITQADATDKANAESNGWLITVFFMLTFVFMAWKYVLLRVTCGIRRNMQFTELDAQGGFMEKLSVVIGNIIQRQGHRFLSFLHELGSKGASELRDFDGNVILKAGTYNGGAAVLQSTAATLPPPTMPPFTPPTNGGSTPPNNGGGGGNNGGGNVPVLPPAPTNGQTLPAPTQGQTATAIITQQVPFRELLPKFQKNAAAKFREGSSYSQEVWFDALKDCNTIVNVHANNDFSLSDAELIRTMDLARAYTAPRKKSPTNLETERDLLAAHEVAHFLTHAHFTHLSGEKFEPKFLRMGRTGGCYSFTRGNISAENRATILMAGIAGEYKYAVAQDETLDMDAFYDNYPFLELSSDFQEALKSCNGSEGLVKAAYFDAYIVLEDYHLHLAKIAIELINKGALDPQELTDIYNRMFPTPTPTPSVVEVKTPVAVVVTEKSVITPQKTVVTPETPVVTVSAPEFEFGDKLLKSLKQSFNAELNNLKTNNGKPNSIMERLITKSAEFDKAVREVKATPKLRTEICEWVGEFVQPLVSEYIKNGKEVTND